MIFLKDCKKTYKNLGFHAALSLIVIPRILNKIPGVYISYDKRVRNYIRKDIYDIIDKFKHEPLVQKSNEENNKVFSLWWQGSSSMSELLNICRQSLKANINGNKLIELDKDNIDKYIKIPAYITERLNNNQISLSNFSDIIRVALLAEYGGWWIDSCLFVTRPIEKCTHLDSPRFKPYNGPSLGKWTFGVLCAPKGHKLMRFMKESMYRYWQSHNYAINYLMMDSFMMIAYEEFEDVREEIDRFTISSPDLHSTRYLFKKPMDENRFKQIIKDNQFLSLTWRFAYPEIANGNITYYGALKAWASKHLKGITDGTT